MRPVNLIPPEERRGERAPLRAGPLSYVVVGALVLAFAGVYALVGTGNSITEKEGQVAALEQDLASSTARAEALRSFTDFASLEQARNETVSRLASSRFDWERVLRELTLVLPEEVTLGTITGAVGGEESSVGAPSLNLTGCATSQQTVARLVAALRDIDGVTRVGLTNSETPSEEGTAGAVAPSAGDAGGDDAGCGLSKTTTFDVTIAFDEVKLDEASGGIVAPETVSPAADDGSGVAAAQAERGHAQDSVDSAEERSRNAVDQFVPGA